MTPEGETNRCRPAEQLSPEEALQLLHELQARQLELETQNAELRAARSRLELALARSADFYDAAPVGYLILDLKDRILETNLTLAAGLGVKKDALQGRPVERLLLEEDRAKAAEFLGMDHGTDPRPVCEVRLRRQDGSLLTARLQGMTARDQNGQLAVAVLDVTACREAENRVRAQRDLLRTIFSEMPGLHSLKDQNFRYQFVNPAFHQFMEKKEEEILGKTDFDLLPSPKARKYRKEDLEVIESGLPLILDEDVSTPLFGKKWLKVTKIPVKDAEGRVAGIISSIQDITERKKMENELLKMQKLESIGVLAGGIAHDFNNLLTSILGNIELAKMYVGLENKAHRRLEQAENASLAAKNLTGQLLTFSRGGAPVTKAASVAQLIRDSTDFTIRGSSVQAAYELPQDLWLAEIDAGQISQVIQNLVKNAEQAMPEGGRIEIRAENVRISKRDGLPLKAGQYLRISVRDEGRGIPEKYLDRIFDPYFTTKPQGSGLGLSICFSIIKRHRGHLTVDSQPEVGTSFCFYLPAILGKAAESPASPELPLSGQGRILIMDDDESVREIAGEMLQHLGYEVEFAADGLEAVKSYIAARRKGAPFAAVLMDLTIRGGMGGREAAGKLIELDPDARVIAASGYATDPILTEYQKYGFRGAVHKPFKVNELGAALRTVL